jgi:hypothetical protein
LGTAPQLGAVSFTTRRALIAGVAGLPALSLQMASSAQSADAGLDAALIMLGEKLFAEWVKWLPIYEATVRLGNEAGDAACERADIAEWPPHDREKLVEFFAAQRDIGKENGWEEAERQLDKSYRVIDELVAQIMKLRAHTIRGLIVQALAVTYAASQFWRSERAEDADLDEKAVRVLVESILNMDDGIRAVMPRFNEIMCAADRDPIYTQNSCRLLYGAAAIAEWFGISEDEVALLAEHGMPTMKLGDVICTRKLSLSLWIRECEAKGWGTSARPDRHSEGGAA